MKTFVGECIRDSSEFRLLTKPHVMAAATFVAPDGDTIRVTRGPADLFDLPSQTEVSAHWHGERRTDGFRLTVAQLKSMPVEDW